jgi:hypothetical protein
LDRVGANPEDIWNGRGRGFGREGGSDVDRRRDDRYPALDKISRQFRQSAGSSFAQRYSIATL